MSTLHRFAEAAVRRDLHRAHALLAEGGRLSTERRQLLTDHLAWMSGLVDCPDARVCEAAAALFATACDFRERGDREHREELDAAIGALLRQTSRAPCWTSDEAVLGLGEQVPWLLDGVAVPQGAGLLLRDPGGREMGRLRAAAYRRAKVRMWGTVSLEIPRQRVAADR
ncbi:hypothetical protein [Marmoricola sp. RAF53]|uniref:hypothetical protein n=1 Tax=Marmoricola sp. RAF53 TaxID=3233059 RepID=UPI003F9BA412